MSPPFELQRPASPAAVLETLTITLSLNQITYGVSFRRNIKINQYLAKIRTAFMRSYYNRPHYESCPSNVPYGLLIWKRKAAEKSKLTWSLPAGVTSVTLFTVQSSGLRAALGGRNSEFVYLISAPKPDPDPIKVAASYYGTSHQFSHARRLQVTVERRLVLCGTWNWNRDNNTVLGIAILPHYRNCIWSPPLLSGAALSGHAPSVTVREHWRAKH